MQEPLITEKDVAAMLSMSVPWVKEMAREGVLPSYKLGKFRRFRASEIEQWLIARASGTNHRRTG